MRTLIALKIGFFECTETNTSSFLKTRNFRRSDLINRDNAYIGDNQAN